MKTIRTDEFLSKDVWNKMVDDRTDNPLFFQGNITKKSDRIDPHNPSCAPLNEHAHIYHSQNGEEGIVEHIFNKIGHTNKVAVEFGAGDGRNISNTLHFKETYEFSRVLIEGGSGRNRTDEEIIRSVVTPENINDLLSDCPEICDLISIDIDGDDYWVWKAMKTKGRVVIIEFHSAIPNDISLAILPGKGTINSHKKRVILNGYYSANLRAFYELAETLGYKFCTTISDNAIFVLEEEFPKLEIPEVSLEECLERYFCPIKFWWTYRDKFNREWVVV